MVNAANLAASSAAGGTGQPSSQNGAKEGFDKTPDVTPPITGPENLSVSLLGTLSARLFLAHLGSIPESKTLILDPSLAGPLGLVIDIGSLKSAGVERMFWMEEKDGLFRTEEDARKGKAVNAPSKAVVYVCRPEEKWLKVIKAHIRSDTLHAANKDSLAHTFHALLTPHRTELSLLSLSPVLSHLSLYDFGIEFVPLEPDLLSLEEEGAAWSDLYLSGDQTVLHRSAMALMTCQMLWGCFPKISGKGPMARRLADLLTRQRREHLASDPSNPSLTTLSNVVDGLVIVERGTDLVTPMCSQLTYTGLVDEFMGIKSAHVEIDAALLSGNATTPGGGSASGSTTPLVSAPASKALKKHRLDPSVDPLYAQIRDLNFSTVGSVLHSFAKKLSSSYDDRHSAQTVSEMRVFVGRLGGLQSEHTALRLHTALTEKLMAETSSEMFNRSLEIQQNLVAGLDANGQFSGIEDLINLEAPVKTVLRLLCLFSVIQGGVKAKALEQIKRDICQTYGYQHLVTLLNLERAGLLTKASGAAMASSNPLASFAAGVAGAGGNASGSGSTTGAGTLAGGGNAGSSSSAASSASTASPIFFERVRQPLRLINDEVSESDPSDVAYVFSGYAPLSVRLVQAVGQKEALVGAAAARAAGAAGGGSGGGGGVGGTSTTSRSGTKPSSSAARESEKRLPPRAHPLVGWKGFEDVLNAIPGETFDFAQTADVNNRSVSSSVDPLSGGGTTTTTTTTTIAAAASSSTSSSPSNSPWSSNPDRSRTTVVFFLGGITYAEVAAIRFMSRTSRNRRWVIATTGIISGGRMMDLAMR